ISVVLEAGMVDMAILMVVASVVGAFYYLRVIWFMYFEEGEDQAVLQMGPDAKLAMSANGVAVLALGILPGWLWALCLAVLG
nr:NADH:ubiquinone oxidoreductase subunit N [Woeseiaceae bacterium]